MNLFEAIEKPKLTTRKKAILYSDGGSRGNPGPAAAGIVLLDMDQNIITEAGEYYGRATNNFAEYSGVILGLTHALAAHITDITVFLDSKLIVEQMKGNWKVKHPDIKPLYQKVYDLADQFHTVRWQHIPREENTHADAIVNQTLDAHR